MRRTIIFATLAILLLTVTGITVAQERGSSPERGAQIELAVQETTTKKSTKPSGERSTERNAPAARDVARNSDKPGTGKLAAAEDETAEDQGESVGEPEDAGGTKDAGKPNGKGKPEEGAGEPEGAGARHEDAGEAAGKGKAEGKGTGTEKAKGKGKAEGKGKGKGKGRNKVTLCHNGNTITVGEPAREAHLRHGDTDGACE